MTFQNLKLLIYTGNIVSNDFPWSKWGNIANGKLKRWSKLPIPVKMNGVVRAEEALDRIENALEQTLFDRVSIANIPDDDIEIGIIVSEWSATEPTMSKDTCGTTSGQAKSENFQSHDYPERIINESGEISGKIYVHLGSSLCDDRKRGEKESDVAVHEFGHALGLVHFPGFGEGSIIDQRFWDVLKIVYLNRAGTQYRDIKFIGESNKG